MKKFALLLSLVVSAVIGAELDEGVIVLTDSNFDEEIGKHPNILVEFYAPWCGHCKKLAPEYAGAAKILAEQDPPLPLGKVDATEQKVLAERFGIQGFPTLFFFKDGEKMEYTGGRTKDAIVSWVTKKSGPASTQADCETIKKKIAENNFVMVYFGEEGNDLFSKGHIGVANSEEKILFFHTNDADCKTKYNVADKPTMSLFRKFEEKQTNWNGDADVEKIKAWFAPLMVPTLFKFTDEEIDTVFGRQQSCMILFRKEEDESAAWVKVYEEAAKANKGKLLFSYSDGSVPIQEKLAEFMGVGEKDYPTVRVIKPDKMLKYNYDSEDGTQKTAAMTVDSITKFVESVVDGTASPHLKSEPIPESNDGPVTVIVGKQWKDIVHADKDVFVKYYAPWCGHCKKLAPVWEELGEAYKGDSNMVIGKFDATANEAEGVQVRGYPTLIFYPKGKKDEPVTYDGDRDLEGFKKWLSENAPTQKSGGASGDATKEDL